MHSYFQKDFPSSFDSLPAIEFKLLSVEEAESVGDFDTGFYYVAKNKIEDAEFENQLKDLQNTFAAAGPRYQLRPDPRKVHIPDFAMTLALTDSLVEKGFNPIRTEQRFAGLYSWNNRLRWNGQDLFISDLRILAYVGKYIVDNGITTMNMSEIERCSKEYAVDKLEHELAVHRLAAGIFVKPNFLEQHCSIKIKNNSPKTLEYYLPFEVLPRIIETFNEWSRT